MYISTILKFLKYKFYKKEKPKRATIHCNMTENDLGNMGALTDARSDGGAALLVAFGTAVACDPCHSVLAGALACGLVACLSRRSDWMAVACCKRTGGGRVHEWRRKTKVRQKLEPDSWRCLNNKIYIFLTDVTETNKYNF